MLDIKSLLTGLVGIILGYILNSLKRKFFDNRPRLEIKIDFNYPYEIIRLGEKVKLTFNCKARVQNKSSLDAYEIQFMLPLKTIKMKIITTNIDVDRMKAMETVSVHLSSTIEVERQTFEHVKSENERLQTLNPFYKELVIGLKYMDSNHQEFYSKWKNGRCKYYRIKPRKMTSYSLQDLQSNLR